MQPLVRNIQYSAYGVTHEENIQTSLQDGTARSSNISTTKNQKLSSLQKTRMYTELLRMSPVLSFLENDSFERRSFDRLSHRGAYLFTGTAHGDHAEE